MNVKFQIAASFAQLEGLCRAVEGLQGSLMCTDRQMFEIILTLEEVTANVIRHSGGKTIEVELDKQWDELVMVFTDDGAPFDPTTVAVADTRQPLELRVPGGLGIHLVRQYTDSIDYRRENQKNIVTLRKTI
jgi:anti-sigma regulatory factor (Ser/Thr protein kinase)